MLVRACRRIDSALRTTPLPAVCLIVSDSGPGIPAAILARIFDPFYTTKADGFGVGLSISRSIVEVHGGELSADNQAAGGAAFTITLPPEGIPT